MLARLGLRGHLHIFYHSFISEALVRDRPKAIVRNWVGHVVAKLIRQYSHIADEKSQAAIKRLAAANKVRRSSTNSAHPNFGVSGCLFNFL